MWDTLRAQRVSGGPAVAIGSGRLAMAQCRLKQKQGPIASVGLAILPMKIVLQRRERTRRTCYGAVFEIKKEIPFKSKSGP